MHFQKSHPQGKLVRAVTGSVFDVAVDVRRGSNTFGRWAAETLVAGDGRALWVPAGFAHGYMVLTETADVYYKCTDYYAPGDERGVRWDDPAIGIAWPVATLGLARGAPVTPIVAPRDAAAPLLADADLST
jgi:dTDP-4-dehydrorhamnose 3,5-epimerase